MAAARAQAKQNGWRGILAVALVYALVIQSFLAPIQRAHAIDLARINAELGIICSGDGVHRLPDGSGDADCQDMLCCLPAIRAAVDAAAILPGVTVAFMPAQDLATAHISYDRPQSRAPPIVATDPLQPRAPPATLV